VTAEGAGSASRAEAAASRTGPALAVIAAAAAAYAGSFAVPLQFDDLPNVVDAPEVHAVGLSPSDLAPAVAGFPGGRWLARASFAVNHAVHGLAPAGYHAVNLALHVLASLLVLSLARALLDALAQTAPPAPPALSDPRDRATAAAIAALLLAVHPVHTQAVTYVVQRMTVMGASFALLAVRLWLAGRDRRGRARAGLLAAAAVSAWLAFSSKENFVVVPGLVLLVEAVAFPGLLARVRARRAAVAAGAAALALAGAGLVHLYLPVLRDEAARQAAIPVPARLLSQGRILLHYLSLLALPLPSRLHVDYAFAPSTALLSPPSTVPALLAVAGLAALAVALRRRAPLVTLALGWFGVALAVEQSVLPIDLVFEQRIYFADVGLFVLAGAAAVALVRAPRVGAWAVAAPIAVLLAAGTIARNERWRDPALLFADEEGTGPGAARGLLTVGSQLRARGRLDEAERVLRRAVALAPDEAGGYVNLGNVALDRGRLDEAEGWYREALSRDDRDANAWYDLAIVLSRRGRVADAMDAYRAAVESDATYTSARVNLALLQADAGDLPGALATLDLAIARDPGSVPARTNRAVLRAAAGAHAGALSDALEATRLDPRRAWPWVALADVHLAAGRVAEARAAAERALSLEPADAGARRVLARIAGR
jgi:tetratricopeptide (TPR) repeat protein